MGEDALSATIASTSRWNADDYARVGRFVADLGAAALDLLDPKVGERILDVGCGNGVSSRRLAHLGARVVAIDASARFLELARARSQDRSHRIDYRLVDATDEDQFFALGEGSFDALL